MLIMRTDAKEVLDEARWLHAFHVQRSESAQQRAVAILGFNGILIALVPNAIAAVEQRGFTSWLTTGLVLIGVSAVMAGVVFYPWRARALSAEPLHDKVSTLVDQVKNPAGWYSLQAARNLTYHPDRETKAKRTPFWRNWETERNDSLIEAEKRVADNRMRWLSASAVTMSLGVILLSGSIALSLSPMSQTPQPAPNPGQPSTPFTVPTTEPSRRDSPGRNTPVPPPAPTPSHKTK